MTYIPEIDPLHPKILEAYQGEITNVIYSSCNPNLPGMTDVIYIQFPSMHHAVQWANTCEIMESVIGGGLQKPFNEVTEIGYFGTAPSGWEWKK